MFRPGRDPTGQFKHFRIGVVPVSVRTNVASLRSVFERTYGSYACDEPAPGEFQFEIVRRRGLGPVRRPYQVRSAGEIHFRLRYEAELLPHLEWAINLQIMRRFHDYYQIHAGVLERNGKGIILPGVPGSGKSTLTAALLGRGWGYLSDEFALFDPATRLLHPYPKALCIKRGSYALIERLGLPIQRDMNYIKGQKGCVGYVNPLAVRPDAVGQPCRLAAVIFPKYDGREVPELTALSRAEAAFELNRVSFNFLRFEHHGIALLADVIRSAHGYRLDSGEINATCEYVEQIVDALAQPQADPQPQGRSALFSENDPYDPELADDHALV